MGTHYKGSRQEVAALNAYIKLVRAAESVTARLNRKTTKAGLSVSQFGVLEALYHLGPLCQRDLGNKLLRSSGNITMVVDNLEKRGLVRRERDEQDRRFISVHLTDKGRRLIQEMFPEHVQLIVEAMSVLTPAELKELERLCKTVGLGVRDDQAAE